MSFDAFKDIDTFTITENGIETEFEVLFSFECEDYNKGYLVYKPVCEDEDEELQLTVSSFDPECEEMQLFEIEDESERAMVSAVLEAYFNQEEEE